MKLYPISVQLVSFTNIKGLILGKCKSGHQKCHYEFTNVTLIGSSKKSMTSLWVILEEEKSGYQRGEFS